MKMLSVQVDDNLVEAIDSLVKASGLYSSRSEFLKDAIRKNLLSTQDMSESMKKIRESRLRLSKLAYERGFDGKQLTREEKEKIADEWIKKNNIKLA